MKYSPTVKKRRRACESTSRTAVPKPGNPVDATPAPASKTLGRNQGSLTESNTSGGISCTWPLLIRSQRGTKNRANQHKHMPLREGEIKTKNKVKAQAKLGHTKVHERRQMWVQNHRVQMNIIL